MPASTAADAVTDSVSTWVPDGEVKAIAVSGSTAYIGGNFSRIAPYTGDNTDPNLSLTPSRALITAP